MFDVVPRGPRPTNQSAPVPITDLTGVKTLVIPSLGWFGGSIVFTVLGHLSTIRLIWHFGAVGIRVRFSFLDYDAVGVLLR